MTEEQEKKIRKAVRFSDWKYPISEDVKIRHVLINIRDLLPDPNIERFLRDFPAPPSWHYCFFENEFKRYGDIGEWKLMEFYERNNWYCSVRVPLTEENNQELEQSQTEFAIVEMLAMLDEVCEYADDKSEEERRQMYEEFERFKQEGPPKEIPYSIKERMEEICQAKAGNVRNAG